MTAFGDEEPAPDTHPTRAGQPTSTTVSPRPYPVRMLAYWHMDGTHSAS